MGCALAPPGRRRLLAARSRQPLLLLGALVRRRGCPEITQSVWAPNLVRDNPGGRTSSGASCGLGRGLAPGRGRALREVGVSGALGTGLRFLPRFGRLKMADKISREGVVMWRKQARLESWINVYSIFSRWTGLKVTVSYLLLFSQSKPIRNVSLSTNVRETFFLTEPSNVNPVSFFFLL